MFGEEARQVLLRGGGTVSQAGVVLIVELERVSILWQALPIPMELCKPCGNESLWQVSDGLVCSTSSEVKIA